MPSRYVTRAARVLRVFCPIEQHTLEALLTGDASALERDPNLAAMLTIIRSNTALGDFGLYKSVVEISPSWELFTPGLAAIPTLGEKGAASTSPTAILTIYVANDAPMEAVDRGIAAILQAHPWEVPVIEMAETALLGRQVE